jgi:hypothetical protein
MIDASITKGKKKLGTKSTVLSTNERRRRPISSRKNPSMEEARIQRGKRNSTNRIEEKTQLPHFR